MMAVLIPPRIVPAIAIPRLLPPESGSALDLRQLMMPRISPTGPGRQHTNPRMPKIRAAIASGSLCDDWTG